MDKKCKAEIRQILVDRLILNDGFPEQALAEIEAAVDRDRLRRSALELRRREIEEEIKKEEMNQTL